MPSDGVQKARPHRFPALGAARSGETLLAHFRGCFFRTCRGWTVSPQMRYPAIHSFSGCGGPNEHRRCPFEIAHLIKIILA